MKHFLRAIALLLPLAACVPSAEPPSQLVSELNMHYGNRPLSEFFYKYGPPAGEFQFSDGLDVYRWTSTPHATAPGAVAISTYHLPTGDYQIVDNFQGVTETQYCELRIYADPQGVIQHFAIAVDTVGKWTYSKCSEIFP